MPVFVVSMYPIVIPKAFIFGTYMDHGSVNKKLMQFDFKNVNHLGSHSVATIITLPGVLYTALSVQCMNLLK